MITDFIAALPNLNLTPAVATLLVLLYRADKRLSKLEIQLDILYETHKPEEKPS